MEKSWVRQGKGRARKRAMGKARRGRGEHGRRTEAGTKVEAQGQSTQRGGKGTGRKGEAVRKEKTGHGQERGNRERKKQGQKAGGGE